MTCQLILQRNTIDISFRAPRRVNILIEAAVETILYRVQSESLQILPNVAGGACDDGWFIRGSDDAVLEEITKIVFYS